MENLTVSGKRDNGIRMRKASVFGVCASNNFFVPWVLFLENPFNHPVVVVMLQSTSNCYAKIQKSVSLILLCATSFENKDQNL